MTTENKILVESLTPEQEAMFPAWVEKWTTIGHRTQPHDEAMILEGMRLAYEAAELEAPTRIEWVDSPKAGSKIYEELTGSSDWWSGACYGQHDAGWLSFYDYFRHNTPELREIVRPLDGLTMMAEGGANWWWPLDEAAIISLPPVAIHFDERGRLHNTNGLALEYADGWGVYAIHGVRFGKEHRHYLTTSPNDIDVKKLLGEENTEIRRAVISSVLGWDRVLDEVDAKVLDEVEGDARLVSVQLNGDEPFHMLDMLNHTCDACLRTIAGCECEGGPTRKRYIEGVPTECKTVIEAHGWRWQIPGLDMSMVKARA